MSNAQTKFAQIDKRLMDEISKSLAPFPEAGNFITLYRDYVHAIDDLIDMENRPNAEELLRVFAAASVLFTTPFWRQYGPSLLMVERMINNTYADSVRWEQKDLNNTWQNRDASVLRHAGVDMMFAIIDLLLGRDKLREISSAFRYQCHLIHMDEEGNPI